MITGEIRQEAVSMDSHGNQTVRNAGAIGLLVALFAGGLFAAVAGGAGPVARFGGAAWVAILTWIILMPVLAPWLKQRRAS